ncbi:S24 family peptidase [Brucella anthropi]|uniref:S24 family peptidase n=1 Tax=Brucella anthropi TaxID=529 RepID=UPI00125E7FE7|nr:S24 family peptidase [Brucella anthropi]QFP61909.1 helix-turn-helix transcriptional regulator [Brucella anthropi]
MMDQEFETRLWLQRELEARPRGTKGALAKYLGLRNDAITRMVNTDPNKEVREIKAYELQLIRQFFLRQDEMPITQDGSVPVGMVRKMGRVGAGAIVEAIDNGADEYVDAPADVRPGTVAVEVSGDSMFPAYEDGTLLYYSYLLPPSEMVNRRCVVQLADQRIFVKVLRKGNTEGMWTLQSLNPLVADIPNVAIEWAAPIDWIKPR